MSPKVQRAVVFLETNLHRRLCVAEIAESVELSPSRLTFLFNTDIGMSPVLYLKKARLERARQLLETSATSVKAISVEVGYNDCTRLMRDFKKTYGVTPSQHRRPPLGSGEAGPATEPSR